MTLPQVQKLVAYLTLLVALGALSLSGMVGPLGMAGMGVAALVSWFWEPPRVRVERYRWALNLALLAFIALTMARVLGSSRWVLSASVQLVLVLTVAKLFQRTRARDYVHLHALSFLMIALSAALQRGVGFGAFFVLYALCASAGLALVHLLRQCERDPGAQAPERLRLDASVLRLLGSSGLVTLGFAGAIFMVLPRAGVGFFHDGPRGFTSQTGFAASVELDDHGLLTLDDTIILRAAGPRLRETPYWRGLAFDHFDGRRWSLSPTLRQREQLLGDAGRFAMTPDAEVGGRVAHEVDLEPIGADVLFSLPDAVAVAFPPEVEARHPAARRNPHWLQVDGAGSLRHGLEPDRALRYTLERAPLRAPRPARPLTASERVLYLQLPTTITARTRALARRLTDALTDPAARAQAILAHLGEIGVYSLELPARDGDPIDHFLFVAPRGHCEFFSSAMVVLLRASGVPARNVNGFMGGDWNRFGDYYQVRNRHAHSWVEAHLPGRGWTRFEPTPPAGHPDARSLSDGAAPGPLDAFLDNLERAWERWVIGYSSDRQRDLLGRSRSGDAASPGRAVDDSDDPGLLAQLHAIAAALLHNLGGWIALITLQLLLAWGLLRRGWSRWTLPLAWLIGAGLLLTLWRPEPDALATFTALLCPALLAWLAGAQRVARVDAAAPHALSPLFDDLQALLGADLGLDARRAPPLRLARALEARDQPGDAALAALVRRYCALRFGPHGGDVRAVRDLERRWRTLRRDLIQEHRRLSDEPGTPG